MHQTCDHTHSSGLGLQGPALADALEAAQARCEADRQKLTPPRRRVLELLLQAHGPVKAYDLISSFSDSAAAKPPTIYRALEFLETQGLAHRLESLNAYIACRLGDGSHAAAFLICDCCGATKEIDPAAAQAVRDAAAQAGYTVDALTVEARGRCAACRS